jgi:hypothetical protein
MFFLAEAIAVGRHFGQGCLQQPPWRQFGTPESCELLQKQSEGIAGFSVKKNSKKSRWEVDVVYPDTPASREPRLQAKTAIHKVNGQSVKRMEYDQLKEMLQGPAGSNIKITVKKGLVFGSKTLVVTRAAPKPFDALLCFGLQFVRRRIGGAAVAAVLSAKLGIAASPTGRSVRRFDAAIFTRVLGRRLMDAVTRSASDEMVRLLAARPPGPFMVSLQVIRECFACN